MEVDITMRLRHSGLTKAYSLIDGYTLEKFCNENNINGENNISYGILMEYVECTNVINDSIKDKLKYLLGKLGSGMTLLINDYKHTDLASGNQCSTENGYKIIDFNNDASVSYFMYRFFGKDFRGEGITKNSVRILTYEGYDIKQLKLFSEGKGICPVYNNIEYSKLENGLIDDLIMRAFHPIHNLDIYEVPLHPIFKLHNIKFEQTDEVDSIIYPLINNFDYILPIERNINHLLDDLDLDEFLMGIDLYYRYLPFVKDFNQLDNILMECFYLVINRPMYDMIIFKDYNKSDHVISFDICNKVKSIKRRNFYHLNDTESDDELSWLLMFTLDYDTYMKICGNNLYKVNPIINSNRTSLKDIYQKYTLRPQRLKQNIINRMVEPYDIEDYAFSKLTKNEMYEFLEANNFDYKNRKLIEEITHRFYIGDICRRIFIYGIYNKSLNYTQAIKDLIVQKRWFNTNNDYKLYTNNEIDMMSNKELLSLANNMNIEDTNDIKDSVKRILRMSYLLSLRD